METSSIFDIVLRGITAGAREFTFEIAPWAVVWLLIAFPFFWLLGRLKIEKMGRVGIIAWITVFTGIIAGICAAIHGVLAFGEAFGSAIDRDRVRAFIVLTIVFPFVAAWLVSRNPKNGKPA